MDKKFDFVERDFSPLIGKSVELKKWVHRLTSQLETGRFHPDFGQESVDLVGRQIEAAQFEIKSAVYQLSHVEVWDE